MTKSNYPLDELNLESTLGSQGRETSKRTLPVISLENFAERKAEIADQLWLAATDVGFFQLSDHGIDQDAIDGMFASAEQFFALDDAIKAQYPLKGGGLNAGWETKAQVRPSTRMADQKESFQVTRPHMDDLWPSEEELPAFQATSLNFEAEAWALGMRVLSCFALKLGFPEDFFTKAHNPEGEGYQSTLRLLHYYPMSKADTTNGEWRAGAHSDFDCLTLLFQREGQGGLQVCPGREADSGEWTSVVPKNNLVTCNIGDMLMRWSDDQLKSTLHRVRMPTAEEYLGSRYSIAFFCQANKPMVIQGPNKLYEPITAQEYLKQRIAANFAY
ncbi:isopenicillin N synthase family dioxygenase [Halioxenophilus sp. WMMB6]|uniref:isopenicillin N synthase family dioxygenase n=1 Tax=Halioxenophilus sp. WMMB6 TaxID=3073815 RepID=UPI00295F387B|nr:2OG-Fe(II) oxygenase family protein [Halioxenophilus sp. WMMB6]